MISNIENNEYLLTWLDVERYLKKLTNLWSNLPRGVVSIDCFYSGMEVRHKPNSTDELDNWFTKYFLREYMQNKEKREIKLRIGNTSYPIEFVEVDETLTAHANRTYPLWRDVTYLKDGEEDNPEAKPSSPKTSNPPYPKRFTSSPELVSFHSFKGGVGRTTALMTYVAACFEDSTQGAKKILVIDADLEAPGVSFWLSESNKPTVSFIQLMEALHYPPETVDSSLDFFADELRKTSINVKGLEHQLYVLPAALNLSEILDMPVTPEHLARNLNNPFQLGDHIHALGKRLGADAVFIDLRAGLSELASPFLFDTRIDHFFVSTVAPQSIKGMAEVLQRLYAYNCTQPDDIQNDIRPSVVLSLLTKELKESKYYEAALEVVDSAYPSKELQAPAVQWLEAEFLSTLMSLGSIGEALQELPKSNQLFVSAKDWAFSLYAGNSNSNEISDLTTAPFNSTPRKEKAKKLYEVCKAAQFADNSQANSIIATEPLLNLGKNFLNTIPNALIIGAKGSGKTFTFEQLVRTKNWSDFLFKLGFKETDITNANIFPVLWSVNTTYTPNDHIKASQVSALNSIEIDVSNLLLPSEISSRINAALQDTTTKWDVFWDDLVASQFGISDGGLTAINQLLIQKNARVVLIFDGVEDAFNDLNKDSAKDAIQALLRLTNRLSELVTPHLGALVFVRIDYVQAAIRQNVGQLISRFEKYSLKWNAESFLRLAYMLGSQAGIFNKDKAAESLKLEDLKTKLIDLWGRKLGGEKSKEAHSARWAYSALCDFKGDIQARDLVRFLKFAAEQESNRVGATWSDRLLSPESMRKAIPLCSTEKVDEAKLEISALKKWAELLAKESSPKPKVPFSAAQAGLDADLLRDLQQLGVIYEDRSGNLGEECLFLPEIYRTGLSIDTSATGRPRVQALLKKNIGHIPI